MEDFLTIKYSWFDLFATAAVLGLSYLLLKMLKRLLRRIVLPKYIMEPLRKGVHWALLFFEPIAALLLTVIYVFIRPVIHAPIVVILLLGAYSHLRNYLSGFMLQLYENIAIGNRLQLTNIRGVVVSLGRLGLQLHTHEGVHFTNYSSLLADGFTRITGKEAGGFYQLNISEKEQPSGSKNNSYNRLEDLLAHAPFISPKHRPDLAQDLNAVGLFSAKVLVEEEFHLQELLALLDERGWAARVSKRDTSAFERGSL
ncbi:MAG: hypothetical protein KDC34_15405 [Saprospiraceae bacterium]|nr:hypothetical protein [Saprospiraceae bacterium]